MKKPDYTLIDYVRWMGGSSFEEHPFSDADALVLCDIVYFEIFDTETSSGKTLRELIQAASINDASIVKRLGGGLKEHAVFIQKVSESRRFGELRIKKYAETLDPEKSIQFASCSFLCEGIFNFIAFRGTDDTIAGWKEDFMIAFTNTTAQDMALNFASANLIDGTTNYIGGHSKGGNLALYAAAMLPDDQQGQLDHVYDLDGPGFCGEVFDLELLKKIQDKTTFIIPEFCVIGKLFEPDFPDTKIVVSSETAVMQHELLSWGINEQGLETAAENDPRAQNINHVIDDWVENIAQDDRQIFVNELFDALEKDGASTMSDLMSKGLDGFEKILFRAAGTSKTTKRAAASLPEKALFGNLLQEFREKGFWKFIATNRLIQSFLLLASGFLFIYASSTILDVVSMIFFTGLTALQIVFTIRRLIENQFKFEFIRERLQFCMIMIVLTCCLYFKEQATFLMGSIIFAVTAFLIALHSGLKIKDRKFPLHHRMLSFLECCFSLIYGLAFLVIPQNTLFAFSASIGAALIIDSLLRILFAILEAAHIFKS